MPAPFRPKPGRPAGHHAGGRRPHHADGPPPHRPGDIDEAVLYGVHPVIEALRNPKRRHRRLLATENALKRLTEDKFRGPRREATVVTLTTEQLHWILDGIDIDAMVRHPVRQYQVAG